MQAVLCGYYGKGNGGDEALLAALLQMLPKQVQPVVLSGDPAQTEQRYGVRAIERMSSQAVLKVLRQSDAFIWGGGSLIQDVTSAVSPFYYGGLMALSQRLGLKTLAWAQGVGPLQRPLTRWMARQTFAGCQGISVRDRGSAQLLAGWGLSPLLAPDPVWALTATPVGDLWQTPAPRVVVALRSHPQLTAERLQCLTVALQQFQQATQTYLLLLPFQPIQDLAIAESIHAQLQGSSQILHLQNPQQLKGVFRGVEMTIAMRFHGLIMAAAEGCRCFALSYDPKVSRLMEELNLPGWTLEQIPSDPALISQTWLECYANNTPLSEDQIYSLVDRSLMHRDLLHQIFF